ncbi:anti-sigma F factor antagonist [Clostridium felsineum]|uniref:anti-sigma F factor antagonist n=1 Tax=Clostridium felsineum TaxID=36839 RepID=UPI00098C287E|nr:anti-sigma F factor antagonist [Clostridium felsineum]URZ00166.1 Anti-sigma F factor antagonist [Clostridium felsineum]
MNLDFKDINGKLVVSIIGELDHHSSEEIRNKIDDHIKFKGYKNVILDFSNVTFMDSSGIGVVIGRYKKLTSFGGNICVVGPKESVKRIFELSGMLKIINIYASLDKAVRNI